MGRLAPLKTERQRETGVLLSVVEPRGFSPKCWRTSSLDMPNLSLFSKGFHSLQLSPRELMVAKLRCLCMTFSLFYN